jgi:hypothetical protein
MVIVGETSNATFLIAKEVMQSLAHKMFIRNSYLYFASMIPLDTKDWKTRHKIKQFPVLLVYYHGKIVAQITEFPFKYQMKDFLIQVAFQSLISNLELEAGKLAFYQNEMKVHAAGII